MVEKLVERKQREADAINGSGGKFTDSHYVPIETLAAMSNGMIKMEGK